jgi:hypothetical protein
VGDQEGGGGCDEGEAEGAEGIGPGAEWVIT